MVTDFRKIKFDKVRKKWKLYPLGDMHVGNIGCDILALKRTINQIANDPDAYWIGMGDYGDFIGWMDPRFDPAAVDKETRMSDYKFWAGHQVRQILKLLEPIKGQCLGIWRGNHEKVVSDRYHYDPGQQIAEALQVKYFGYEGMLKIAIIDNRNMTFYSFTIYVHHGFGGGKKPGSHVNNLHDLALGFDADLFIMGHNHRVNAFKTTRLFLDATGNFRSKDMAFMNSGNYLKMKQEGIEGYEVTKGYLPTYIGTPCAVVCVDHEKNLRIELRA